MRKVNYRGFPLGTDYLAIELLGLFWQGFDFSENGSGFSFSRGALKELKVILKNFWQNSFSCFSETDRRYLPYLFDFTIWCQLVIYKFVVEVITILYHKSTNIVFKRILVFFREKNIVKYMCSSLSRFASLSTHSFPCLNRNAADLILHRTSQSPQISTIVWTTARRGRPRSSTSVRDALPSAPASVSAGLRLVPRRLQSSPRQPPCSSLPRALSTSPHAGVVYQHGLTHIPASKNACRRFRVRNQPGHGRGRGCGPYPGFVSERGCTPSVFS